MASLKGQAKTQSKKTATTTTFRIPRDPEDKESFRDIRIPKQLKMETRSLLSFGRFRLVVAILLSTFLSVAADEVVAPPAPAPAPVPPPAISTSTSWGGCVDPVKGYQPVTIGEPTTICLVLASDGDWSTAVDYMRLNFSPTADDYSRFRVPQSFTNLVGAPNLNLNKLFPANIYVHAESQTA